MRRQSDAFAISGRPEPRKEPNRRLTIAANEVKTAATSRTSAFPRKDTTSTTSATNHPNESDPHAAVSTENAENILPYRPPTENASGSKDNTALSILSAAAAGVAPTTPGKTPSKRIALNAVASRYFKVKSASKPNTSFLPESPGTTGMDKSFLSSSSSSSDGDVNNVSTLSDTTELTASNFVRMSMTTRPGLFASSSSHKAFAHEMAFSHDSQSSQSTTEPSPSYQPTAAEAILAANATVQLETQPPDDDPQDPVRRRFSLPFQPHPPFKSVVGTPQENIHSQPPLTQRSADSRTASNLTPGTLRQLASNLRAQRLEREKARSSLLQEKHDGLQQQWDHTVAAAVRTTTVPPSGQGLHMLPPRGHDKNRSVLESTENLFNSNYASRVTGMEDVTVQSLEASRSALSFLHNAVGSSPTSPIAPRDTSMASTNSKVDEYAISNASYNSENRDTVELDLSKQSLKGIFQDQGGENSILTSGFKSSDTTQHKGDSPLIDETMKYAAADGPSPQSSSVDHRLSDTGNYSAVASVSSAKASPATTATPHFVDVRTFPEEELMPSGQETQVPDTVTISDILGTLPLNIRLSTASTTPRFSDIHPSGNAKFSSGNSRRKSETATISDIVGAFESDSRASTDPPTARLDDTADKSVRLGTAWLTGRESNSTAPGRFSDILGTWHYDSGMESADSRLPGVSKSTGRDSSATAIARFSDILGSTPAETHVIDSSVGGDESLSGNVGTKTPLLTSMAPRQTQAWETHEISAPGSATAVETFGFVRSQTSPATRRSSAIDAPEDPMVAVSLAKRSTTSQWTFEKSISEHQKDTSSPTSGKNQAHSGSSSKDVGSATSSDHPKKSTEPPLQICLSPIPKRGLTPTKLSGKPVRIALHADEAHSADETVDRNDACSQDTSDSHSRKDPNLTSPSLTPTSESFVAQRTRSAEKARQVLQASSTSPETQNNKSLVQRTSSQSPVHTAEETYILPNRSPRSSEKREKRLPKRQSERLSDASLDSTKVPPQCDTRLIDSPARNTRSAKARKEGDVTVGAAPNISKRSPSELLEDNPVSRDDTKKRKAQSMENSIASQQLSTPKAQLDIPGMPSSVRSSKRHGKGRKSVMFGSPQYLQFNTGSPSMSCQTPASTATSRNRKSTGTPIRKIHGNQDDASDFEGRGATGDLGSSTSREPLRSLPSDRSEMSIDDSPDSEPTLGAQAFDYTVELEQDMKSLLGYGNAAPTPTQDFINMGSVDDCTVELEKDTVELEQDMKSLLGYGNAAPAQAFTNMGSVDDYTVELEKDIKAVLEMSHSDGLNSTSVFTGDRSQGQEDSVQDIQNGMRTRAQKTLNSSGAKSVANGTPSDHVSQDDLTMELELDMGAVLNSIRASTESGADSTNSTSPSTRRRAKVASRRFSLAPQGKSSMSTKELEDCSIKELSYNLEAPLHANEFMTTVDIKNSEILRAVARSTDLGIASPDVFIVICSMSCAHAKVSTNECLDSVCKALTDGVLDLQLDAPFKSLYNHAEIASQLQRALRDGKESALMRDLEAMAHDFGVLESMEYLKWLAQVITSLKSSISDGLQPMDEAIHELSQQDKLLDPPLCLLSSLESTAVRQARRISLSRQKVRPPMWKILVFHDISTHSSFGRSMNFNSHRLTLLKMR